LNFVAICYLTEGIQGLPPAESTRALFIATLHALLQSVCIGFLLQ